MSLKLHTMPLPASHVQVGNGWWNNRFHQFISPPVKQKSMRLAGRTAEIPLLALAGLMHLGVTRLVGVLGGAGRANDAGVHDGASVDPEAALLQLLPNLGKQGFAQLVVIEEFAKLQQGGGIGRGLAAQINADKAAQAGAVIQRVLTGQIRQVEPVLPRWTRRHPSAKLGISQPFEYGGTSWKSIC